MLAIIITPMNHNGTSMSVEDVQKLASLQSELENCWTDKGPDFLKIIAKIEAGMISARNECLLILALFNGNNSLLTDFLQAADSQRAFKPATIPTLMKRLNIVGDSVFAERNIQDVLQPQV